MLIRCKSHPVIRSSSVFACHVIVGGSIVGYVPLIIYPYLGTDGVCSAIYASYSLAFTMIFGALFAKTWRLSRLFQRKNVRVRRIGRWELAKWLGIGLAYEIIIQYVFIITHYSPNYHHSIDRVAHV
jgi:hypothetical protein